MFKRILTSSFVIAVLCVLAVGLIGFGGVRGIQAAPRIQSADYRASVELTNIETALLENGEVAEGEDDLLGMDRFRSKYGIDENGDGFEIGRTYDWELAARNVGNIDEFVRVTVYRYWTNGEGKRVDLDPSLIDLHFVEGNGWSIDKNASTPERTVLYYTNPKGGDGSIAPNEDTTPFVDKLTISGKTVTAVTKLADGDFKYEGIEFKVKATVDAVQTHNATDAMNSAWGRTNVG